MSRYIVEIVDADGSGFLGLGRKMRKENATRYPHPSNATAAGRQYEEACGTREEFYWYVVDTRNGRRIDPVRCRQKHSSKP